MKCWVYHCHDSLTHTFKLSYLDLSYYVLLNLLDDVTYVIVKLCYVMLRNWEVHGIRPLHGLCIAPQSTNMSQCSAVHWWKACINLFTVLRQGLATFQKALSLTTSRWWSCSTLPVVLAPSLCDTVFLPAWPWPVASFFLVIWGR